MKAWQGRSRRERRGEGLTCGGCNRWLCYWRRQAAVLVVHGGWRCCFSSLSLLYFSFSSLLLFSSSFGLPLLFSLLSLLFSALSFLFPPICLVLSPVFIGKTGEIEAGGGPYAATPKTARGTHLLPLLQHVESFGQVGLVEVFLRESWQWKTGEEKIFFFPCFARPGEEERLQCRSKRHRFGLFFFFFLTVHETASFWAKRAVSFKRKRRKKCVRVHIGPQFVICSIES